MIATIDAKTRLVGLLGDPVEHSLSPLIHNTAFEAQEINLAYAALRVRTELIGDAVRGLRALDFVGANVTVPHKRAVLPHLDELSPQARAVGAVNTIVFRQAEGAAYGDNTDVAGFLAPLLDLADRIRGGPIVVLGSGGAARAIVYALVTTFEPSSLTLATRSPEKAERLADDLAAYDEAGALAVSDLSSAGEAVRQCALLVNATPVGMYPQVDNTPWAETRDFGPDQIVYDIVYNPEETRLLRDASHRGAVVIGGLDMLVAQAAAAYSQWTGTEMPIGLVKSTLRRLQKS